VLPWWSWYHKLPIKNKKFQQRGPGAWGNSCMRRTWTYYVIRHDGEKKIFHSSMFDQLRGPGAWGNSCMCHTWTYYVIRHDGEKIFFHSMFGQLCTAVCTNTCNALCALQLFGFTMRTVSKRDTLQLDLSIGAQSKWQINSTCTRFQISLHQLRRYSVALLAVQK
jgi:hypothetical protein